MKISWTEHRSNQEVLELDVVDENRSLVNIIRQKQKNWLPGRSCVETLVNRFCVQS